MYVIFLFCMFYVYMSILALPVTRSKRNPPRQMTQPLEASSSLLQVPPRSSSGASSRRTPKPPSSAGKASSAKNKKRDRGATLESSGKKISSF